MNASLNGHNNFRYGAYSGEVSMSSILQRVLTFIAWMNEGHVHGEQHSFL